MNETLHAKMKSKTLKLYSILTLAFVIILLSFNMYTISFVQKRYKLLHPNNVVEDSLDFLKLINISFTFTKLPKSCAPEANNFVILIHSAVSNFQKRRIIRETWGQYPNINLLFMLASSYDMSIERKLEKEYKQHDDIVQGSFLDSYSYLTYKHVMTLKYAVYYCRNVKYVFKTDDDIFINTPALVKFFDIYKINDKIACFKHYKNPVPRTGKYAVSVKEYPGYFYPFHCSGSAIIYPMELIPSLYVEAQRGKFFWVDDVYITGILTGKLGIELLSINDLMLRRREMIDYVMKEVSTRSEVFLFGEFELGSYEMKHLWEFAVRNPSTVDDRILLNVHP